MQPATKFCQEAIRQFTGTGTFDVKSARFSSVSAALPGDAFHVQFMSGPISDEANLDEIENRGKL
jgi:hypothetical protein